MALRSQKSTTQYCSQNQNMSFAETVSRQLNGHHSTKTMNDGGGIGGVGGGGGGGSFTHQKENLPQRRHTFYNVGSSHLGNRNIRKSGGGISGGGGSSSSSSSPGGGGGTYPDSDVSGVVVQSRSTSVVLDPSSIPSVGVHASAVTSSALQMMTSTIRACPTAKVVCWSVQTTLGHPLTPQRLCPQPLRRKLYQRTGGGGFTNNTLHHNHIDLLETTEWTANSDEEVSSGDEEELTSLEKDECIGKLAFGRRKLKLFDQVTSTHHAKARKMIKQYWRNVHNIRFESKLHTLQQDGSSSSSTSGEGMIGNEDLETLLMNLEQELVICSSSRSAGGDAIGGDNNGTTNEQDANSLRVALVVQSLLINPQESLEGIAECYDGLVAAGAALIEHEDQKNRSISVDSQNNNTTNQKQGDTSESGSGGDKNNSTSNSNRNNSDPRSVLATLTPLLITTLEPLPGEAILQISKLYNLCATVRYKRRFVHRIAPLLIRPSSSAVWCVKHQNDMASIIVVTEFLMEHAHDIFSPQWVERGRLLKADGLRAENLRLAALQLKNLDKKETALLQNISSKGGGGGGSGGVGGSGGGSRHHGGLVSSMSSQDGSVGGGGSSNDTGLAEWEVLDVDRYIRSSIRFVFDRQWTSLKATKHHAPSGRIIHHTSSAAMMVSGGGVGAGTSSASLTVTSTGAGGCPMSPRKIPLSPSTYVNPSPNSQYMMEVPASSSTVGTTPNNNNNNNNNNAIASPAASSNNTVGFPPPISSAITADGTSSGAPLTPKPTIQTLNTSGPMAVASSSGTGTPPRSPSSPPKTSRTLSSADTSALGLNPPTLSNVIQVPGGGTATSNNSGGGNSNTNGMNVIAVSSMMQIPSSNSTTPGGSISSNSSVVSTATGATMKRTNYGPVIHYTLTKSAEERKRTVAACRALRAQINRFEEAFCNIHNRHPKGAAERAPLATTYAQYREWKRAIRADAATRIQALYRGALSRWTMIQRNSPRLTEVVRRSSRRSSIVMDTMKQQQLMNGILPHGPNSMIGNNNNNLSPPGPSGIVGGVRGGNNQTMEIDNKSVASGSTYGLDVEERTCVSTEGMEVVLTGQGRRGNRSSHKNHSAGASGKHHPNYHQGGSSSSPSSGGGGGGGGGWQIGRSLRGGGKHHQKDIISGGGPFDGGGGGGGRAHLLSPKPLDAASTANSSSASGDSGRENYIGGGLRANFSFMKPKASSSSGSSNKYSKVPAHSSSGNSIDSGSDSEASQSSRGSRGSYSASSQSQLPSFADASLADLMVQKRELKAQLKSYDLNFAKRHGRMPVKAEKEPIRKLYEQYNALKAHISMLESGGGGGGPNTINTVQSGSSSIQSSGGGGMMSSQVGGGGGGNARSYGGGGGTNNGAMSNRRGGPVFGSSDRSVDSAGSEESFGRNAADMIQKMRSSGGGGGGGGRSNASVGSSGSVSTLLGGGSTMNNNNAAMNFDNLFPMDQGGGGSISSGGNSNSAPLPTDLRSLKEEKGTLHQMLRSYEKDFFREHNRQVSSFADIRPVASQYRRYKEIKKAIAAQQQQQQQAAERS